MNLKKSKYKFIKLFRQIILGLLLIFFLFGFPFIVLGGMNKISLVNKQDKKEDIKIYERTESIISPTINNSPSPTVYYNAPKVDADPLVNCLRATECGGGSEFIKRSICNNSVCCEIRGNYYFYHDRNQCTYDQQQSHINNSTNYKPYIPQNVNVEIPTYTVPTYTPIDYNGYNNPPTLQPYPTLYAPQIKSCSINDYSGCSSDQIQYFNCKKQEPYGYAPGVQGWSPNPECAKFY